MKKPGGIVNEDGKNPKMGRGMADKLLLFYRNKLIRGDLLLTKSDKNNICDTMRDEFAIQSLQRSIVSIPKGLIVNVLMLIS